MDSKLVSVLIPVFNGSDFVAKSIQSILDQTYSHWELIISNDASTDNTEDICKNFSDKRIHYYKQNSNIGIAKNRNFLLEKAKGEFIAILDSDDMATKDRLKKQVNFLNKNTNIDIVASWVYLINHKEKSRKYYTNPNFLRVFMAFKNCFVQSSVMFRKDNITYSETMDYVEDYDLWTRLSLTKNLGMVPEYLCYYTMPDNVENKLANYNVSKKLDVVWKQHYEKLYKSDQLKTLALMLAKFSNSSKVLGKNEREKIFIIIKTLYNNCPLLFRNSEYKKFLILQIFRLIKKGGISFKLVGFLLKNFKKVLTTLELLRYNY